MVTVSTNFWMIWSEIVAAEVKAAREAHAEAVASVAQGDGFTGGELRHALVAIVGAAFAVDGFYGATRDVCAVPQSTLDKWASQGTQGTPRTVQVFSTLCHDSGFSTVHARYTADAAERAAVFAFELIETCIRKPKPRSREWAKSNEHIADVFAGYRAALPAHKATAAP